MGGMATLVMVAAVAMELPEMAANRPQAARVAWARPPLRWPSQALAASYSSPLMSALCTNRPMRMNMGSTDMP